MGTDRGEVLGGLRGLFELVKWEKHGAIMSARIIRKEVASGVLRW